jgi:hypothetical protein
MGRAKEVGPANLGDTELLEICAGTHRHIKKHYWVDCQPFLVELWKRIEEKRIPEVPMKKEACRLIGCSPRWAQLIVAGTAKRGKKNGLGESAPRHGPAQGYEPRTNQEYVADIRCYAERKLKPLWVRGESRRSRNIYNLLSQHFTDAAKIKHIDGLNSGSEKEAA